MMTAQRNREPENKSKTTSSVSDQAVQNTIIEQMKATTKVVEQLSKQMEKMSTVGHEKRSKLLEKGFQSK